MSTVKSDVAVTKTDAAVIKTLVGVTEPTAADTTTIMNFLKKINDAQASGGSGGINSIGEILALCVKADAGSYPAGLQDCIRWSQIWGNATYKSAVGTSRTAVAWICNNAIECIAQDSQSVAALVGDTQTMAIIANSYAAMAVLFAGSSSRSAVIGSYNAMLVIGSSPAAMAALADSSAAMLALAGNVSALNTIVKSTYASIITASALNDNTGVFTAMLATCGNNPSFFTRKPVAANANYTSGSAYYHSMTNNSWNTSAISQMGGGAGYPTLGFGYSKDTLSTKIYYEEANSASIPIFKFAIGTLKLEKPNIPAWSGNAGDASGEAFLAV